MISPLCETLILGELSHLSRLSIPYPFYTARHNLDVLHFVASGFNASLLVFLNQTKCRTSKIIFRQDILSHDILD